MAGVKRERDGAVGILTLDEPATLNAMTPELLGDLAAAIGETTADSALRALVATRHLRKDSVRSTYTDQFRRELAVQADILASADGIEGRTAFVEIRSARFSGR